MKKKMQFSIFAVVLIGLLLVGCGKSDMKGIILEVTENEILFSDNLSSEKFEEIKNKSISTIQKEERGISLTYLTYDDIDDWEKGDEVKVWIDGDVFVSHPARAKAEKISLIE